MSLTNAEWLVAHARHRAPIARCPWCPPVPAPMTSTAADVARATVQAMNPPSAEEHTAPVWLDADADAEGVTLVCLDSHRVWDGEDPLRSGADLLAEFALRYAYQAAAAGLSVEDAVVAWRAGELEQVGGDEWTITWGAGQ